MKLNFKNQIILLTGATSGIGVSIVKFLADTGATIALHYNENEKLANSLKDLIKNNSQVFKADLSDKFQTEILFNTVIKKYGKIDVLINNAGIYEESLIETEDSMKWLSEWDRTIMTNLTSSTLLCKLSIAGFLRNTNKSGGRIINISSRAAFRGDTKDHLAYAASKGGMISVTRSIARAYGKQNIKAFAIAPGFVRTKMSDNFITQFGEKPIVDELSLNEMTEADDIAPTVAFLASGLMDHSTGCTIDINGGSYIR